MALQTARERVAARRDAMRAYERVEWTRAELEGWLIEQAYKGMLRAWKQGGRTAFAPHRRKQRS